MSNDTAPCAASAIKLRFPYMDPAPVQRGLERDAMIPVASVYPASVNGPRRRDAILEAFRVVASIAIVPAIEGGPWDAELGQGAPHR